MAIVGVSAQQIAVVFLGILGSLQVARTALRFTKWTWRTFLRPGKKLSSYGTWAVVTGATDGIGRAMCMQLARQKINVLVVGRSPAKVQDVVTELENKYSVETRSAIVDFVEGDLSAGFARIESAAAGLGVGILVNNVGMSYPYARYFHEVDEELTRNLIRVNIEVTTRMIQMFLPGMLKRQRGAIINVGSGSASCTPSDPLYSVYAASKAFVDQLSRCLYVEYKHKGIDVQCQVPLYVATKMSKIRRTSIAIPSPSTYARGALQWIGYEPRCAPYWAHSVLWWMISVFPESVIDSIRLNSSLNIRSRGMSKETSCKTH